MYFDWSSLILFGGVINALISIVVFIQRHGQYGRRVTFWIPLFLVVVALILCERMVRFSGLETNYPELLFLTSPLFFLLPPVLYVFQSGLHHGSKRWYVHFIVPIVMLVWLFPTMVMPNSEKLAMYQQEGIYDPPLLIVGYLFFVGYYSTKTFLLNQKHKAYLYSVYSSNTIEVHLFANTLVFWASLLLFCIPFSFAIQYLDFDTQNLDKMLYIVFSCIPHFILISIVSLKGGADYPAVQAGSLRSARKQLEELEALKVELSEFMTAKAPYLNQELQLQLLADSMGWSRSQLSQVINSGFGKNFYDFVNEYRLKAVLGKLDQGLHKEYSLDYIVGTCGFRNYVSFYRMFKRFKRISPQEYLKQLE